MSANRGPMAVTSPQVPLPRGHYSHAMVANGLVFVSGQLPIGPDGPLPPGTPFDAQVRQVLANTRAIVEAAGSSLDHVVRVTVYIADIALWPEFNRLYAEFFGTHRPARTVVPVPGLHDGYALEVDAVAMVRG